MPSPADYQIRQITEAEAERLGGVSDPPDIETVPWTNKRTGETRRIPQGIDPGWDTNPGKTRHRTLADHLAGHLDAAPDEIRRAAMVDLVGSQMFRRVANGDLAGHTVFAPVAVVPENVAMAMGSTTRVAFFSTADASKQLFKRPELAADDYVKVQMLLDGAQSRREGLLDFSVMGLLDGTWWRAVFHVTKNRDEVFLKSFRRSNPSQVRKYISRSDGID